MTNNTVKFTDSLFTFEEIFLFTSYGENIWEIFEFN